MNSTIRKALVLLALIAAPGLPLAAQLTDCAFTFSFTTDANQTGVPNLSNQTPCVNWRITYSVTATLTSTVTFQTSPDNVTFTSVPNTLCSSVVQPPCILQGANPLTGTTQGMSLFAAYGAYVRVVTSGSAGTGTGTVRGYGSKGATASAASGGSGNGSVTSVSFTGGLISVTTPTTTPALTVAGTSGGVPYFSGAATWASSGALAVGQFMLGGGAGNPPTTSFSVVPVANGGTGASTLAGAGIATRAMVPRCVVIIGDPGAASAVLADDNDSPVACGNSWGSDWTITSVACWANAGSPTVTPILTGGSATSILTGALTCGTGAWAPGTVNGTPVLHTFSADGSTCASTPCTADVDITTAGGVAKYIVIRIVGTL